MHIPYPKIRHLNSEECEGILQWDVYIQEKLDGSNLQIAYLEWWLVIWSRTQVIYHSWKSWKEFRWAQDYVLNHVWILQLFKDNPNYRLFGEYLVKHTIVYPEQYYNKFYMFDILDWDDFLDIDTVYAIATKYNIETPILLHKWKADEELIKGLLWKSALWVVWEWVVIKNPTFINKFMNKQYAKVVRPEFKEANQIVFWNYNKWDVEMEFATKFITEARLLKIINKIEQNENRKIYIKDTPKVLWLCYYDAFTEELWWFAWKKKINFLELQKKCWQRCRFLFHERLNNNV